MKGVICIITCYPRVICIHLIQTTNPISIECLSYFFISQNTLNRALNELICSKYLLTSLGEMSSHLKQFMSINKKNFS